MFVGFFLSSLDNFISFHFISFHTNETLFFFFRKGPHSVNGNPNIHNNHWNVRPLSLNPIFLELLIFYPWAAAMRLPWWGWRRSLRLAGIAQHESMVASIGKSVSCCPAKIMRFQTLRPDSKMQEQTLMSSQSIVIMYRLYGMLYGQYW